MTTRQKNNVAIIASIGALICSFLTWVTVDGIAYKGAAFEDGVPLDGWLFAAISFTAIFLLYTYAQKGYQHTKIRVGSIISGLALVALGVFEIVSIQSYYSDGEYVEIGPALPVVIICGFVIVVMHVSKNVGDVDAHS